MSGGGEAYVKELLRQGYESHKSGETRAARWYYEQAIQRSTHSAEAHYLLGTLYRQQGEDERAIEVLERAVTLNPNIWAAQYNLANAYAVQGRHGEAESVYRNALAVRPGHARAHLNLGLVLKAQGRRQEALDAVDRALMYEPELAEAYAHRAGILADDGALAGAAQAYRQALEIEPDQPSVVKACGRVLRSLGRAEEAILVYRSGLSYQPDDAALWNDLGNALYQGQRWEEAEHAYRKAIELAPEAAYPHNNLGTVLYERGRYADAIRACDDAIKLDDTVAVFYRNKAKALSQFGRHVGAEQVLRDALVQWPSDARIHSTLGQCLLYQGKMEEAARAFAEATRYAPDDPDAAANYIKALDQANDLEKADEVGDWAKTRFPENAGIIAFDARVKLRLKKREEARQQLEAGLDKGLPFQSSHSVHFTLGEIYDHGKDADRAFDQFARGNHQMATSARAQRYDKRVFLDSIDDLEHKFTPDWVASWRATEVLDDGVQDPLFLIGFPRSGTTLMDTLLRGHPRIDVMEETGFVGALVNAIEQTEVGYPEGLAYASTNNLKQLRGNYDRWVRGFFGGERPSILVDKLPLHSIKAGALYRIFPRAKFIFALRHPCDVVLSCLMQNFQPNDSMVNFFELEDTAHFYDRVMTIWNRYTKLLPLDRHTLCYENLIADFEGEARRLFNFLNVEFDERVLDFQATAKGRSGIKTPSYRQVTEGLYTHARYRWERYWHHLEPVLPILAPWVRYYGYPDLGVSPEDPQARTKRLGRPTAETEQRAKEAVTRSVPLRVKGCDLHGRRGGPADGRPVVLLHGARFTAATWEKVGTPGTLADAGHDVWAFDLPGYGHSPPAKERAATLLSEIIARFDKGAILVAPSMSGPIAAETALKVPEKIAGLVLIAPVQMEPFAGKLHQVKVPGLVVWGDKDQVADVNQAEKISGYLAQGQVAIMPGCGHLAYLEDPEGWHGHLLAFLRQVDAPDADQVAANTAQVG